MGWGGGAAEGADGGGFFIGGVAEPFSEKVRLTSKTA